MPFALVDLKRDSSGATRGFNLVHLALTQPTTELTAVNFEVAYLR